VLTLGLRAYSQMHSLCFSTRHGTYVKLRLSPSMTTPTAGDPKDDVSFWCLPWLVWGKRSLNRLDRTWKGTMPAGYRERVRCLGDLGRAYVADDLGR